MACDCSRTTYNMVNGSLYVCDPIHGTYKVSKPYVTIVETKEMQRLKEITQTGFSFYDYPNMEYEDRLSHSLGAYHIMEKILDKLETLFVNTSISISKDDREIALCAILLHDIGHGPFSHSFETISNYSHEKRTTDILLGETDVNKVLVKQFGVKKTRKIASFIAEIDESEKKDEEYEDTAFSRLIKSLISHQIDADRLDYLVRDAYYAGIESSINVEKIINAISIAMNVKGEYEVIMDKRNLTLIETPLIERFQHYRDIYFTPGSVIGDNIFKSLVREMKENPEQELMSLLPNEFNELIYNSQNLNLDTFLLLTDKKVYDSLNIISKFSKSPLIRHLAMGSVTTNGFIIFEDIFAKDKVIDLISSITNVPKENFKTSSSIYEIYAKTKFYKKDEGFKIRSHQNIVDLTDVTNLVNARDYVEMKCTAFNPELFYFENGLSKIFKNKNNFKSIVSQKVKELHVKEEEFELKYLIKGEQDSRIALNKAKNVLTILLENGFNSNSSKSIDNYDLYFDTKELELYKHGKIARIREKKDNLIGTYKEPLEDGNIYTSRKEIEVELSSYLLDELERELEKRGVSLPLNIEDEPKLRIYNHRNEHILSKGSGKVSFCIDHVTYVMGTSKFDEVMIEIEAYNDLVDRSTLTEIHEILTRETPKLGIKISVTNESKYSRGMKKIN